MGVIPSREVNDWQSKTVSFSASAGKLPNTVPTLAVHHTATDPTKLHKTSIRLSYANCWILLRVRRKPGPEFYNIDPRRISCLKVPSKHHGNAEKKADPSGLHKGSKALAAKVMCDS